MAARSGAARRLGSETSKKNAERKSSDNVQDAQLEFSVASSSSFRGAATGELVGLTSGPWSLSYAWMLRHSCIHPGRCLQTPLPQDPSLNLGR